QSLIERLIRTAVVLWVELQPEPGDAAVTADNRARRQQASQTHGLIEQSVGRGRGPPNVPRCGWRVFRVCLGVTAARRLRRSALPEPCAADRPDLPVDSLAERFPSTHQRVPRT